MDEKKFESRIHPLVTEDEKRVICNEIRPLITELSGMGFTYTIQMKVSYDPVTYETRTNVPHEEFRVISPISKENKDFETIGEVTAYLQGELTRAHSHTLINTL
jgi:hypothetical protein